MKIKEFLEALCSVYGKNLTSAEANWYYRAVKAWDLNPDQLENLFDKIVAEQKYFPRPQEFSEIKRAIFPVVFTGERYERIRDEYGHTTAMTDSREYLQWRKDNALKLKYSLNRKPTGSFRRMPVTKGNGPKQRCMKPSK